MSLGKAPLGEQSYRNQFENKFDFFAFKKQLINQVTTSDEQVAALIQLTHSKQANQLMAGANTGLVLPKQQNGGRKNYWITAKLPPKY